jgi:hypothetical protein
MFAQMYLVRKEAKHLNFVFDFFAQFKPMEGDTR